MAHATARHTGIMTVVSIVLVRSDIPGRSTTHSAKVATEIEVEYMHSNSMILGMSSERDASG